MRSATSIAGSWPAVASTRACTSAGRRVGAGDEVQGDPAAVDGQDPVHFAHVEAEGAQPVRDLAAEIDVRI